MEIENENNFNSAYAKHCRKLKKKYIPLIGKDNFFIVNWFAKIHKKNSLTESEGRCGGGPTRSPQHVRYKAFELNWDGITFYIDQFLDIGSFPRVNSKINVAVLMEPMHFRSEFYEYIKKNNKFFDIILTHDLGVISKYPDKSVYCIAGAPIIENSMIGMNKENKNKLVSTCYSKKGLLNRLTPTSRFASTEGHRFRHNIVKSSVVKEHVDLYGSGSPRGPSALKSETLVNHMFSVVIENGVRDTYFTEKLMDCFLTGNIPIYRGSKKLDGFFDKRGIIEFNTLEELEYILKNKANKETYNKMLPYAENNLNITNQYLYIDDIMLFSVLDKLESMNYPIKKLFKLQKKA